MVKSKGLTMRKKLFHLIIIIIFSFSLTGAGVIRDIGIDFGAGQSFELDYFKRDYNKFSISSNFFIDLLNFKYFSLKISLGYSQKGSNSVYFTFTKWVNNEIVIYDSLVDETRKSDYLTLGVFLKPQIPFRTITPYLILGPRIDYLMKRQYKAFLSAEAKDVTDISNHWIYGFSLGIGNEFNINKIILSPLFVVDIDINKSKAEFDEEYKNFKYSVIFSISYKI